MRTVALLALTGALALTDSSLSAQAGEESESVVAVDTLPRTPWVTLPLSNSVAVTSDGGFYLLAPLDGVVLSVRIRDRILHVDTLRSAELMGANSIHTTAKGDVVVVGDERMMAIEGDEIQLISSGLPAPSVIAPATRGWVLGIVDSSAAVWRTSASLIAVDAGEVEWAPVLFVEPESETELVALEISKTSHVVQHGGAFTVGAQPFVRPAMVDFRGQDSTLIHVADVPDLSSYRIEWIALNGVSLEELTVRVSESDRTAPDVDDWLSQRFGDRTEEFIEAATKALIVPDALPPASGLVTGLSGRILVRRTWEDRCSVSEWDLIEDRRKVAKLSMPCTWTVRSVNDAGFLIAERRGEGGSATAFVEFKRRDYGG